jgi:hypothetical protein
MPEAPCWWVWLGLRWQRVGCGILIVIPKISFRQVVRSLGLEESASCIDRMRGRLIRLVIVEVEGLRMKRGSRRAGEVIHGPLQHGIA